MRTSPKRIKNGMVIFPTFGLTKTNNHAICKCYTFLPVFWMINRESFKRLVRKLKSDKYAKGINSLTIWLP